MQVSRIFLALIVLGLSLVSEAKQLECESLQAVEGWNGGWTREKLKLSALLGAGEISEFTLRGAYDAVEPRALMASASFDGQWQSFGPVEDAWCTISLVLPLKRPASQKFAAYLEMSCDDHLRQYSHRMDCELK
jgi:hypothetical protein